MGGAPHERPARSLSPVRPRFQGARGAPPRGPGTLTVTFGSATSLTCTTGAHAAGAVDVVVTNPDTKAATASGTFTYVAAPTIISASPTVGSIAGSTVLTITGTGFVSGSTVSVGGVSCTSVTVASLTSLTCATGAHGAGVVDIVPRTGRSPGGSLSNRSVIGGSNSDGGNAEKPPERRRAARDSGPSM